MVFIKKEGEKMNQKEELMIKYEIYKTVLAAMSNNNPDILLREIEEVDRAMRQIIAEEFKGFNLVEPTLPIKEKEWFK